MCHDTYVHEGDEEVAVAIGQVVVGHADRLPEHHAVRPPLLATRVSPLQFGR